MDLKFLTRCLKTTAWVTLVIAIFSAFYYNVLFGIALIIGSVWNLGNFWLIIRLANGLLINESSERKRIISWLALKFPGWYGLGYLILRFTHLPVLGLLIGFSLLFAVIILKVLGLHLIGQTKLVANPKSKI